MTYKLKIVAHRSGKMRVLEVWHACRGGELRLVVRESAGADEKRSLQATEELISAGLVVCPECGEKIR